MLLTQKICKCVYRAICHRVLHRARSSSHPGITVRRHGSYQMLFADYARDAYLLPKNHLTRCCKAVFWPVFLYGLWFDMDWRTALSHINPILSDKGAKLLDKDNYFHRLYACAELVGKLYLHQSVALYPYRNY